MSNPCEGCPITKKIATCCGSNPDTSSTRVVRLRKSGQTTTVCDNLANDGLCEIYGERPKPCMEYVCPEVYARGLNSSS
jgi:hypothetical protein